MLQKILDGQPSYRQKQIQEAVYKQLISDWSEALTLPKDLRDKLEQELPLAVDAEIFEDNRSKKALINLDDGNKVEAVMLENNDGRHTVCVSSQVGCPLNCTFCATGKMGFVRNLTAQEIIDQVLIFARLLKKTEERVDNVVFMGMGEPFLNWDQVSEAITILNDEDYFGISARSISVSTCGLPDGIKKLIEFPLQINLALSLHASEDWLRQEIMPVASQFSLKEVMSAVNAYIKARKRKVMFEYIMISGVNDSDECAKSLAYLINSMPEKLAMVNLIPFNPGGGQIGGPGSKYTTTPMNQIKHFRDILEKNYIEAVIRESLGGRIEGACGQLATKRN
jgi:23S rRNA (adenine2503-C2)-methyltransferase